MDNQNVSETAEGGTFPAATGSSPYHAYAENKRIYIRTPHSDEWGSTHCDHGISINTAERLRHELDMAINSARGEIDTRHKFEADKKYPWFCGKCGYPPEHPLMHLPTNASAQGMASGKET